MDKFLSVLNIIVFGLMFIVAFNSFFVKKNVNLNMDGKTARVTTISALVVVLLPVMLGLVNLF